MMGGGGGIEGRGRWIWTEEKMCIDCESSRAGCMQPRAAHRGVSWPRPMTGMRTMRKVSSAKPKSKHCSLEWFLVKRCRSATLDWEEGQWKGGTACFVRVSQLGLVCSSLE